MTTTTDVLTRIGFTSLEAEIYVALLEESPLTGYRIAQILGKPAANIYKAIEALERKGAVVVDTTESRLCRAVPPDEVLAHIERQFRTARDEAAAALAELRGSTRDERIYQLRSVEHVFERARRMIDSAQQVVLVDAFPRALEAIRAALSAAAQRGAVVVATVYEDVKIEGVTVIVQARGEEMRTRWPGEWLNVTVDGNETLLALLTRDAAGVQQATWSGSAFLAAILHSGISAEAMLADLETRLGHVDPDALRETIDAHRPHFFSATPGFRALFERLAATPSPRPQNVMKWRSR